MATVELTTRIDAPQDLVFDLARNVGVHEESLSRTGERAVGGTTKGLLGEGDQVTWRGRHLGIRVDLTAEVTGFDRPDWFRDEQVDGPFASMVHDHRFERRHSATLMTDEFRFESPLGPLGAAVDVLFLRSYVEYLLRQRADHIKELAESGEGAALLER